MAVARAARSFVSGLPAVLVGLVISTPLEAQEISTKALELKVGGRVQMQAETSSCDDFPVPGNSRCAEQVAKTDLLLRRVRVSVEGRISEEMDFKVEPDFAKVDELRLKDAWGRYTFSPAARLKVGHFKRPFDGFELISSTQILTIERDVRIDGLETLAAPSLGAATAAFNLGDRDVGVELSGTDGGHLSYWAGVFTGDSEDRAQDTNSEKQFIGRVQVATRLGALPFRFAVAGAATDRAFRTDERGLQSESYTDFEVFSELGDFGGGAHLMAGVVFGDNPLQNPAGEPISLETGDDFATFASWQVIGSWKFPTRMLGLEAIEPLLRVTWGDPNTDVDDDAGWGFTPGVMFFLSGRNRLAVNWDFAEWEEDGIRGENALRSQLQFHF